MAWFTKANKVKAYLEVLTPASFFVFVVVFRCTVDMGGYGRKYLGSCYVLMLFLV